MTKTARTISAIITYFAYLTVASAAGAFAGAMVAIIYNGISVLAPIVSEVSIVSTAIIFGGLTAIAMSFAIATPLKKYAKKGRV